MAFDYLLGLATEVSPAEVLEAARRISGGVLLGADELQLESELWANVSDQRDPVLREAFSGTWGFDAAVRMSLAMGHGGEPDARWVAEDLLAVTVTRLVVELDGDAGMDTQNDNKLLLRRDGVLTLYGDWRPWREPHVVEQIPAPFKRAATPQP